MADQGLQPHTLLAIADKLVTLTPDSYQDPIYDNPAVHWQMLDSAYILTIDALPLVTGHRHGRDRQCYRVCQNGDLFVSFLVESDEMEIQATVCVSGYMVDTYTIRPNQYQLGVLHGHIFPLISLPYNEMHLVFDRPVKAVRAVYACLAHQERQAMAKHGPQTFAFDEPVNYNKAFTINPVFGLAYEPWFMLAKPYPSVHRVLCYGKQAFDQLDKPLYPVRLPQHIATGSKMGWSAVKARMNTCREELMQVTWHPNRFMDWCLSIEDRDQEDKKL
jgi:hypothetical protein